MRRRQKTSTFQSSLSSASNGLFKGRSARESNNPFSRKDRLGRGRPCCWPRSAGPVSALLPDVSLGHRRLSRASFCFIRAFYIRVYRSARARAPTRTDTFAALYAVAASSSYHSRVPSLSPNSSLFFRERSPCLCRILARLLRSVCFFPRAPL